MSTARVDFTRGAAERIARVVRIVEQGDRDGNALTFRKVVDSVDAKSLSVGEFTGDWHINGYKTITFYGVTSTPNTASVLNLCTPSVGYSAESTSETRLVIYGKAKYTTDLVVVEIQQPTGTDQTACISIAGVNLKGIPGYAGDEIQMLGHDAGECLQWYSITTCATATFAP